MFNPLDPDWWKWDVLSFPERFDQIVKNMSVYICSYNFFAFHFPQFQVQFPERQLNRLQYGVKTNLIA